MNLPDIQKTEDTRNVAITAVGVTGIKVPIRIKVPAGEPSIPCHTVAEFEMSVNLPRDVKGTHMSRFTQVLTEFLMTDESLVDDFNIAKLHTYLLDRLGASTATISAEFDYFTLQPSPVAGVKGIAPIRARLEVLGGAGDRVEKTTVIVDGKTVCPCSREISEYDEADGRGKGAHAQRSRISLEISHLVDRFIPFEELVGICQRSFSSPVYPVLKRPDEKHVTMGAYANPKFVEDVIRDVVVNVRGWASASPKGLLSLHVRVQNSESIHYHDAYATTSESLIADLF